LCVPMNLADSSEINIFPFDAFPIISFLAFGSGMETRGFGSGNPNFQLGLFSALRIHETALLVIRLYFLILFRSRARAFTSLA
jgi:hypothetical protein